MLLRSLRREDEEVISEDGPQDIEKIQHSNALWSLFEEVVEANKVEEPQSAASEMVAYLQEPRINPSNDILDHWKESRFLNLKQIARKYLATPSATVSSERLFSTSGLICDKKRSRLDSEKVQMLVFSTKSCQDKLTK